MASITLVKRGGIPASVTVRRKSKKTKNKSIVRKLSGGVGRTVGRGAQGIGRGVKRITQMLFAATLTLIMALGQPTLTWLAVEGVLRDSAHAKLNQATDPTKMNTDALPASGGDCDNICSTIIHGGLDEWAVDGHGTRFSDKKDGRGLKGIPGQGGSGWDFMDDQWCADHGSQTESTVVSRLGAEEQVPDGQGGMIVDPSTKKYDAPNCVVPLSEKDVADAGDDVRAACQAAGAGVQRCGYHNSQVEEQCLALHASKDALNWQFPLLALDIAAFGTCTTVCAMAATTAGTVSSALEGACIATSMTAGGAEVLGTIVLENSPIQSAINGVAGAAGFASGAYMLQGDVTAGSDVTFAGRNGGSGFTKDAKEFSEKPLTMGEGDETNMNNDAKAACVSAASFAVLTGLRAFNIKSMDDGYEKACKQVKKLASNASTAAAGGAATGTNRVSSSVLGGSGAGTTGSSSGSGTTASLGSAVNGGMATPVINGVPQQGAMAIDGQLLKREDFDKKLSPMANQLNKDQVMAQLRNGGAGALAAGAMGAAGGTDIGQRLAALAGKSMEEAPSLISNVPGAASSFGGGGGGGRGGSSDGGISGMLGSLFGGKGGDAPLGAGSTQTSFGNRAPASDVFHAGSELNLFQIVSGKIGQVSSRVTH